MYVLAQKNQNHFLHSSHACAHKPIYNVARSGVKSITAFYARLRNE